MLSLVPLVLLAAAQGMPTIGDYVYGHAMGIKDTVDLTLRPVKTPDCQTEEEIRQALADKAQHHAQSCILPKSALQPKPAGEQRPD